MYYAVYSYIPIYLLHYSLKFTLYLQYNDYPNTHLL